MADKIKDTARRIARLGAYLTRPFGPTAKKAKGVLTMDRENMDPLLLMCDLRDGRVWERSALGDRDYALNTDTAIAKLAAFEALITRAVSQQLREEVIQDLVNKRLRRIVKASERGFKADLKKGKKKPKPKADQ